MNAPTHHPPAVRTTCPYCGVGCGVLAKPDGRGGALIAGDPEHPANFGRLCSKGSALGETLGRGNRLLHPMLRQGDGVLARVTWDTALDRVADGFARTVAQHGPAHEDRAGHDHQRDLGHDQAEAAEQAGDDVGFIHRGIPLKSSVISHQ